MSISSASEKVKNTRHEFHLRVRLRMTQLNMNQAELAKGLEMSQSSISDWFNPKIEAIPDGDVMMQLPRVLRCNGHWLITGIGPVTLSAQPDQLLATERAAGMHRVVEHLRDVLLGFEQEIATSGRLADAVQDESDRAGALSPRRRRRPA